MRFYILLPNADVAKACQTRVLAKQMPYFIQAPRVDTYHGGLSTDSSLDAPRNLPQAIRRRKEKLRYINVRKICKRCLVGQERSIEWRRL